jgi:hypothetical protein
MNMARNRGIAPQLIAQHVIQIGKTTPRALPKNKIMLPTLTNMT